MTTSPRRERVTETLVSILTEEEIATELKWKWFHLRMVLATIGIGIAIPTCFIVLLGLILNTVL